MTRVHKLGGKRAVNERMPVRKHANRWPGNLDSAKIHCSGGTVHDLSPGGWRGWDRFLKATEYRGQDGGRGVPGGLGRIPDSIQRVEITPDDKGKNGSG